MPKAAVTPNNLGGVLERVVIDVPEDNDADDAISAVIEGWCLSVGDTIEIREITEDEEDEDDESEEDEQQEAQEA